MKLTQADVGKKVRRGCWSLHSWARITAVGERVFIAIDDETVSECIYSLDDSWEYYSEPKKKIRLAPALIKFDGTKKSYEVSRCLYESEFEARACIISNFYRWPASENLWIEVDE